MEQATCKIEDLPQRLRSKISIDLHTGCWVWTAAKKPTGYGNVWWQGKYRQAHRLVYETLVAPIPDGMQLDHFICEQPSCVNPGHLRPVTPRENTLRATGSVSAVSLAKTHCLNGHELTPENLDKMAGGVRRCSECRRTRERKRYALRRSSPGETRATSAD